MKNSKEIQSYIDRIMTLIEWGIIGRTDLVKLSVMFFAAKDKTDKLIKRIDEK